MGITPPPIHRRRGTRPAAAAVALAALVLALGAPARADASTCSLSNGVLDVQMNRDTTIEVVGEQIQFRGSGQGVLVCSGGTPTRSNVDGIRLRDRTDDPKTSEPEDGNVTVIMEDPNALYGGRTVEPPGQLSEIELYADLGLGDDRLVAIANQGFGVKWAAGRDGINFNQDDDADLSGDAFDHATFVGTPYDDRLSARGGLNLGLPVYFTRIAMDGRGGEDQLLGGDGADVLEPGLGDNVVSGFGGGDTIVDLGGNDSISGGLSFDSVIYNRLSGPVRLDLRRADRQETGAGSDVVTGIENVNGSDGGDTFVGTGGPEHLDGNRGDDVLVGGGGDDVLNGGDGFDTASYADAPGPVRADLAGGRAVAGTEVDTLERTESLVGSPFADVLAGDGEANLLIAGPGADRLDGEGGADRIDARDGDADAVTCGAGTPDAVTADRRGVDTIGADCEAADLLPDPPGAGQAGGRDDSRGTGASPRAAADRTLAFRLTGARTQRVARTGLLTVRVSCPAEPCTATVGAGGTPRRLTVRPVTRAVRAGAARTVALRLSRAQLRIVRRTLARRGRVRLTVRAVARDAAGNRATRTLRVTVAR